MKPPARTHELYQSQIRRLQASEQGLAPICVGSFFLVFAVGGLLFLSSLYQVIFYRLDFVGCLFPVVPLVNYWDI